MMVLPLANLLGMNWHNMKKILFILSSLLILSSYQSEEEEYGFKETSQMYNAEKKKVDDIIYQDYINENKPGRWEDYYEEKIVDWKPYLDIMYNIYNK